MIQGNEQINPYRGGAELPLGLFQKSDPRHDAGIRPEARQKKKEKTKKERSLICVFCSNIITSPDDIFTVSGNHRHTFTNPAGITFRIGTFKNAAGCKNTGTPAIEYTWFPGYSWSFALCSLCRNHLGWFYQSGTDSFYGLILENLTENI